jgi:integrase
MASVSSDQSGRRRVLFTGLDKKRKTLHLGKLPAKSAESICLHVEALLVAKISGQALQRDTASWLGQIADTLREKMAKVGLVESCKPVGVMTIKSLVDEYKEKRTDIKPATLIHLDQAARALIAIFGADRLITSVTEADAEDFYRQLLADGLAFNTARRRTGRAKQYFKYAVRKRVIASNPFNEIKTATSGNAARQEYVPVSTIQTVLDSCPSAEWRLIVALSRFAGLRCPSEHLALTWEDIHWDTGRFTVHSPKTEHIEGKAERIVPIFPELYPYLRDAFELAEPGQVNVIVRNRCDSGMGNGASTNWRTTFLKIIKKAGMKQWPRLFHALRASCQTDLSNEYPSHVVCAWMGNSLAIAQEHYLQTTEDHFKRAATQNTFVTQNPTHPTANQTEQDTTDTYENPVNSFVVTSGLMVSGCEGGQGGT